MTNFILIAVCILSGILVKRYKALPPDSFKAVNAWLINIALPAVALKYLPRMQWTEELLLPLLMPFFIWTAAYFCIKGLARVHPMDKKTKAALLLTAGLGNTSFLGFPLTQAYFGDKGLPIAVFYDQATFIIISTLAIFTAVKTSNGGVFHPVTTLRKIFSFPPFIAFILAFVLPPFIDLSPALPVLDALAVTLVPLALFSVGMQLPFKGWNTDGKLIAFALSYKLVLAPLVLFLVCLFFSIKGLVAEVSILESAMAPMVTGAIIATDYELNPGLANKILGIGILVSFLTTFIWSLVIPGIG
ncbi:AEC family transporter [Sinomicrobium weinanense]|uniref:AEC family transporter n=1 Tax=Sinomicrobium weinanense TaxID=2842200 RepID=A0A926Q358_9FLAO|nr:AEC family transporter [Sinomicrobium weinanense]MBC9795656.1 AEC family transporter [Sinomicrobium weinanense]MBU3122825.1 AEC family transporter [Sinomicrobium weinanense]